MLYRGIIFILIFAGCSQSIEQETPGDPETHEYTEACSQREVEENVQQLLRDLDAEASAAFRAENELRLAQASNEHIEKMQEALCIGQSLLFEGEFAGIRYTRPGYRLMISNASGTYFPFFYTYDFLRDDRHVAMLENMSVGDRVRFEFTFRYDGQKVLNEHPYREDDRVFVLGIDLAGISKI